MKFRVAVGKTSDEIKQADRAITRMSPRKRMMLGVGIVAGVIIVALAAWYLAIIAPDQRYKTAMNHAEEVIKSGSSVQNGQEADTLAAQADKFRTNAQREAAYRKVGQLYSGKGDLNKALSYYQKAESIQQTTDFAQILHIAYLAQTAGNYKLAVAYYQRALDQYNKNPQSYSNAQQLYMKAIPSMIDSLKARQ